MLQCKFCKTIPNQESNNIENLETEIKTLMKENNYKFFECICGNHWIELNHSKELFDFSLFNRDIKTFDDINNLIFEMNNNLELYHLVPLIYDSLSRINDWIISGGNINDVYITNILKNLKKIDVNQ